MIRQREANETALAAIGGRKRVKQEEGPNMLGQQGRRLVTIVTVAREPW